MTPDQRDQEQEINKTIAEYMGEKFIDFDPSHGMAIGFVGGGWEWEKPYTTSLDACISAVVKLGVARYEFFWLPDGWVVEVGVNKLDNVEERAKSPALALSAALAKAIKEIS